MEEETFLFEPEEQLFPETYRIWLAHADFYAQDTFS